MSDDFAGETFQAGDRLGHLFDLVVGEVLHHLSGDLLAQRHHDDGHLLCERDLRIAVLFLGGVIVGIVLSHRYPLRGTLTALAVLYGALIVSAGLARESV